jgi:hydrogenase-4 membrane subunit HyfE
VAPLSLESARAVVDLGAVLLLATALGSLLTRRIESAIRLLVAQGVLLAAASAAVALSTGKPHAYAALGITLAVKVVAVPLLLLFALREARDTHELSLVVARAPALVIGVALVLVAYYAAGGLLKPEGFVTRNALPTALSMLLLGLFSMLTRKQALSQVAGLVAMENGIYLAAIVATQGLPLAAELGAAVDLLTGVLVMGLVSRQIHRAFDTGNVDRLRALRG